MNPYLERLYPWLWSFGVLLGMIVLGLIVQSFLYGVGRRVAARTGRVGIGFMIARSRVPARVLFPLLFIALALPELPLPPHAMDTLQRLVGMGFIGAAAWMVIAVLEAVEDAVSARYPTDVPDNLSARRIQTQVHLLQRVGITIVVIVAAALILMKFPSIQHLGTSLLASAGLAGLAAGMAARPMLSNLIAGMQLALTEPIRIDDAVMVEGEFGNIEEITSTYVIVRIWDQRRMVLPLSYFIEHPFQNWTLSSADLIGTVLVHVDYTVPVDEVRRELQQILESTELWDRRVWNLQVTDATEKSVELRAMMSASGAGRLGDLRVLVREKLVAFLQNRYPQSLPTVRAQVSRAPRRQPVERAIA
jgi:small-conductance mechanosensitive channel